MKKSIKILMLLSATLLISNQSVNAQWALTGNPAATNANLLGATGANINLRIFAGGAAAANERIRITGSNGNVGIGTLAPATKLHVLGTTRLQGATAIVGATTITGAATISGLTTTATLRVTGGAPGLNKILRSDATGLASWIVNPVGANTTSRIPRWNGTQLVTGTIFDNGTNIGIGTVAPTQKLHVVGNILTSGTVSAVGGNSTNWNSAFGWGNHAAAGYLTAETDPQVGANVLNYAAKWNGTALVNSGIYNNGNFYGLGTTTSIGAANLVLQSPNASSYGGMYINQTGSNLQPFYGYAVNGGSSCWTYFEQSSGNFNLYNSGVNFSVTNAGNVGIGNTAPTSKLSVVGNAASTNPVVEATNTYVGNSDVRGVKATSKAADGYGIAVEGTGGYMGGYFIADAGAYTGSGYGVYASASGTAGTRYGVYGSASGGTNNWGGYFPTKTYTSEIRVGTTGGATGYIACIGGKLIAEEVRVTLEASWPDYVFADNYNLMSIYELEQSIKSENHLPGLPSACEVEENGLHLGEMQTKIVEKLEESHLYIIQLQKQIDELKAQLNELKK